MKTTKTGPIGTWSGLLLVLLLLSLQVLAPGLGMTRHDHYDLIHDTHDLMFGTLGPASRRQQHHKRTLQSAKREDKGFLGNELESLLDRSLSSSPRDNFTPLHHPYTFRLPHETPEHGRGVSNDVTLALLPKIDGLYLNDLDFFIDDPVPDDSPLSHTTATAHLQTDLTMACTIHDGLRHNHVLRLPRCDADHNQISLSAHSKV